MSIIIGREAEKQLLSDAFNSRKAEFLAIYGRRRVGKTYLIDQFFTSKSCLYFQLTGLHKGTLKEHLALFAKALSDSFFSNLGLQIESPRDWLQAFELLTSAINKLGGKKRIVLFFDELPWLASPRSGFKKALDYYWNTVWSKNSKIILVICGSAASWVIKNIINDKGGLHNRVTLKLRLSPFSLKETYDYLHYAGRKLNHQQVLEIYMALGGIPDYLEKIKPSLSAAQNISELCFSRNGQLFDEFDKLFSSLFNNAKAYVDLIKLIAQKRNGITRQDIGKKAKLSETGGTLSERLTALEETGFIKSFIPIGNTERGLCYKVIDEYCLLYLTWVAPIKKKIENEAESTYWISKINTPAWHSWSGYAFEAVCMKHVTQIKKALFIPLGALSDSWHYSPKPGSELRGAQIDLLFDRDDGVITLCEIKYSQKNFEIDKKYAHELINKVQVFKTHYKTKKQVFISMVTADGLKKNRYSEELITSKATLDDLF
jgi:AAA+ ATPase superfamily predicted ATPase